MIEATGYRGAIVKSVPPQGVSEFLQGGGLVWVDVVDAGEDDLARLAHEFSLHPLAVEDARKGGQRAKLERYPAHGFLVAYCADEDPRDLPELHVFIGPGWLVTLRFRNKSGRCIDLAPVAEQFTRTRGEDCSSGFLLYTLLDVLVDGYFDVVDHLDEDLEDIEDAIFEDLSPTSTTTSDGGAAIQRALLELRRSLTLFRRRVVPLREVLLSLLRRELDWVDDTTLLYLQDVLDHQLRVVDQLDSQRELIGNAVDAYLAVISNRSNDIMKKMTSWGAILLGSTLIAGIYGMNFRHMPELGWQFGYAGALTSMALLTLVLFVFFRRRGWL